MQEKIFMALDLLKSSDYNYNQKLRIELAKLLNKNNENIENNKNLENKRHFNIKNIISIITVFMYDIVQKILPQKYKTISKIIRKTEIEHNNIIFEVKLEQINSLSNLTLDKFGYREFSFKLYNTCINVKYGYSVINCQMLYSSRNFDEINNRYIELTNLVENNDCLKLIDLLIDENNNKINELIDD